MFTGVVMLFINQTPEYPHSHSPPVYKGWLPDRHNTAQLPEGGNHGENTNHQEYR